jgi:hypothetical protein
MKQFVILSTAKDLFLALAAQLREKKADSSRCSK